MANIVIMELKAKVLQIIDGFQRVDIVFDTYQQNAIKSDIGMSVRFSVRQDTPVYKKFQDFMRCDDNRIELFQIISSSLSKINCPTQIVTTKFSNVESNCNIRYHKSSNCMEADGCTVNSRMVVQLIDAWMRGVKRVLAATVDTEIVVFLICHFFSFKFEAVWVEMGVGQHRLRLPIHTYHMHSC